MQKYQQAVKDFNKTIEIDSENANAYYWRGLTYRQRGDREAANPDFQEAANLYEQQGNQQWFQRAKEQMQQ